MKKINNLLIVLLMALLFIPNTVLANMAAPTTPDVGSTITFERNDAIFVQSELLDITVKGSMANIVATYQMQNSTNEMITTPVMFLSPNILTSHIDVQVNQETIPFSSNSYALNYASEIKTDDWQYAVLTQSELANREQVVEAISFELQFEANQTQTIKVSYDYQLGGYPTSNFNAKKGVIEYYLAPAAMWKGFENLTINLTLDEDMPIISRSTLEFKKISDRTYQYVSNSLPETNLEIVIDENWIQNIFSTFRSPYLLMTIRMFLPYLLIVIVIIAVIVFLIKRKR